MANIISDFEDMAARGLALPTKDEKTAFDAYDVHVWCHAPGLKEVGNVPPKKYRKARVLLKWRKWNKSRFQGGRWMYSTIQY